MNKEEYLMDLFHEAYDEVTDLGIEPGPISSVKASPRMTQCLGKCHREKTYNVYGERQFSIKISERLIDENAPEDFVKNTLIHEILHTCEGCFNHGPNWKALARRVNAAYPQYNIQRTNDAVANGVSRTAPSAIKYRFRCMHCGQVIERTRMSKFVKRYDHYRCGRCRVGKFETI